MPERLLIAGGAQYLPFARSRIRALRKAGLQYASQRYVFPDATVRVTIMVDQDYIEISGGACAFDMDSGVVELTAIGAAAPGRYLPGILYETDLVAAYQAPFVLTPPETFWRYNPNATGQIAGSVVRPLGFVGRVPIDEANAKSFSPGTIDSDDVPPVPIPNPADDELAAKKRTAALCPPSVFTGRCRLWVQAMYGRFLHQTGIDNIAGSLIAPPVLNEVQLTTAPSIFVKGKSATGTVDVQINTSCGVYLDPATGDHWLMIPESSRVAIYPLISNSCGQGLRRYLISGTGNDLLNQADRDRVEAYVLAISRPDATRVAYADIGASVHAYSMGYGWHWNFTGLVADIVVNDQFGQSGGNAAMVSTHHRITMAPPTETSEWGCLHSIVEGPTNWAVYRPQWTILEPNYVDSVLQKVTPKNSTVFACNAPFYAFYIGNTLKTCRVSTTLKPGITGGVVYNNCYGTNLVTMGLNVGSRTTNPTISNYYSATFTCDSVSSPELPSFRNFPGVVFQEVRDKVKGSLNGPVSSGGGPGTRTFEISDDFGGGRAYVVETSELASTDDTYGTRFYYEVTTRDESYPGYAAVIVPFYDAEAIYIRSKTEHNIHPTARTTNYMGHTLIGTSGAFIVENRTGTPFNSKFSYAKENGAFASDNLTLISTTSIVPADTSDTLTLSEKLVCRAGVVDATFSHLNEIHDNNAEQVGAQYATLSGVVVSSPIVIAPGFVSSIGAPTVPAVPALVGYV